MTSVSLVSIVAYARSGALDHAWRLFRAAGLEGAVDDPAVLSVRGRLLKARALEAEGAARREPYRQAAEAYGRAGALSGATYPLINAATLALLSGDADQARARAQDVLARLEAGGAEPDTPYYEAATRAEALLLTGDVGGGRGALEEAMALAPRAWEDHASTLRQFALILAVLGADAAWLDPLRPPRSLYFAGHMALAPGAAGAARQVAEILAAERVGFGFGALAAGADIVVAEALLARGAELHLVLPAPPEAFRSASVAGSGGDWGARFDAVLAQAETVTWVGHPQDPPHPLGVRLAAEAAMGQAVMHARTLASEAVQLLILDTPRPEPGEAGGSAWVGEAWRAAGLRQQVVLAPRDGEAAETPAAPSAILAAVLLAEVGDAGDDSLTGAARLADGRLSRLGAAMAGAPAPLAPPSWRGREVQVAFATPADAADAALAMAGALGEGLRIAGAYGLARLETAPAPVLLGPAAALPEEILRSVPPGAIHIDDLFAAALQIGRPGSACRTEYVGEVPGSAVEAPTRLHALKGGT